MFIKSGYTFQPILEDSQIIDLIDDDFLSYISNNDFTDLFDRNEFRRLGNLIRNSVGCGLRAIHNAHIEPDAIITGSGKGSISKIEQFLTDIDTYAESALNPGVFIQSTHNTINGQLALKTNCIGYNVTYVNQGLTLFNILNDANLFLTEHDNSNVLAGTFEENTMFNSKIYNDSNYLKIDDILHNANLLGEGVTFFVLSNQGTKDSVSLHINQAGIKTGTKQCSDLINHLASLTVPSRTLILNGANTKSESSDKYLCFNQLGKHSFSFKQITGEHDTAGSFALFYAWYILSKKANPHLNQKDFLPDSIIIVNHFKEDDFHVMLLQQ